jgi:cobalt/nickel transport system permease protein
MSDWLFHTEDYTPSGSQHRYLHKSSFRLLTILARLKGGVIQPKSLIYQLHPTVKLLTALALIIGVAISQSGMAITAVFTLKFLELSLLHHKHVKRIMTIGLVALLFATMVMLPAILFQQNHQTFLLIGKIITSVIIVNILSYSTKWRQLTGALSRLRVPNEVILLIDITLKYIFILGRIALNMFYALQKKNIGIDKKRYNSLGSLVGILFIKSKHHTDQTWQAMQKRGFNGIYSVRNRRRISITDTLYLLICILLITALFTL